MVKYFMSSLYELILPHWSCLVLPLVSANAIACCVNELLVGFNSSDPEEETVLVWVKWLPVTSNSRITVSQTHKCIRMFALAKCLNM